MLCLREHVDGLDLFNAVFLSQDGEVAGLRGRVAAHINDPWGSDLQELTNNLFVHAGAGRIGDDDVRTAMLSDKGIVEH